MSDNNKDRPNLEPIVMHSDDAHSRILFRICADHNAENLPDLQGKCIICAWKDADTRSKQKEE